jgi:hypothetical protein
MKRTTASGSVSGLHVDRVAGVTAGTKGIAEDRNNWQEEICNLVEGMGFTLDGTDQHQLERSAIAARAGIGDFVFKDAEITPVPISASRSSSHPAYPEYNPIIPRYDANHDVSTSQVPQSVVDHFRAIKGSYKGVSDFAVTASGSVVTLPSSPAALALLYAIQADALVSGWLNGGQTETFNADYATASTLQTVTISGVEFTVAAVAPGSYQLTVVGSPSAGTLSVYPCRITGSTTSFRLLKLAGFVPAAGGDADGQYTAMKRVMDRLQGHYHILGIYNGGGTAGNAGIYGTVNANNNVSPYGWAMTASSDGIDGTPRTGKTTDSRAFTVFIGTWVRNLLATSWTSA